jgi:NADPH:quinone reductase-like Zn-dependent oxidoreductase
MLAATRTTYGPPRVLEVEEVERPAAGDDEVLVRVAASSLNRADWYLLRGHPWAGRPLMGLRRPKSARVGIDFSGVVEAVGGAVSAYAPGDEVYGTADGALAEYVALSDGFALRPSTVAFDEAAAVPIAGVTALQGLRDHGRVSAGSRVLVNGASGGVGTFAVQIAKALGADVTAVCSTAKVDQARALGADSVVDYTRDDFTMLGERYDVVFDNAGSRPWGALRRVLAPAATIVLVGGPSGRLVGPLGHIARIKLHARFADARAVFFIAKVNEADLSALAELIDAQRVRPVIDRRYELARVSEAFAYLGEGHAHAKIVVTI